MGPLEKCLKRNKSSSKAWEYMGHILEKELRYQDAVDFYENAWQFARGSNAVIGYKLAFNYYKAKRYIDAIDVCHEVLKKDPSFSKIRKEVLEKARANIR